jgi:hypothetical protein
MIHCTELKNLQCLKHIQVYTFANENISKKRKTHFTRFNLQLQSCVGYVLPQVITDRNI